MLAIKDIASGEFFDIPSDTAIEIDRTNPYIGTDEITGENTLPLNMFYTDKNYRLMGYYGNFYRRNKKLQIDVEIYDNTNYKYTGVFVVQQHTSSMNMITNTKWVGIITFNASSFFQDAKDKFLNQIDLGGVRTFAWTGSDPNDGSTGFWQHIHEARTPNAFDYTFYPIINPAWAPFYDADDTTSLFLGMNLLGGDLNEFSYPIPGPNLNKRNTYSIVPMMYISFLLQKVFGAIGWKLEGEILDDPGFKKLTLVGTRAIAYKRHIPGTDVINQVEPIVFDLQDFVKENLTLYKFIIDFKNRFGWKFIFNSNTRVATITSLKSSINKSAVDFTKYVASDYVADYKQSIQNYSLINNIDQADDFPLSADTNRPVKIASIAEASLLADPTTQDEGVICYAFKENTWYQVENDYTTGLLAWVEYSHNVDSYISEEPTIKIESDMSTMPTLERKNYNNDRLILVPVANYLGNPGDFITDFQDLGQRILFYHGMVNDSGGVPYPYASCHSSDWAGNNDLTPWSISYHREFGSINNGVYEVWFKEWLAYISSDDVRTIRLALPAYVVAQFSWDIIIRINDVDFVPISYKEILPYPGIVEFKLKRVN